MIERQSELEALRKALLQGEQSGAATPLVMSDIKRKARASRSR
jgi:hypothetical protein